MPDSIPDSTTMAVIPVDKITLSLSENVIVQNNPVFYCMWDYYSLL